MNDPLSNFQYFSRQWRHRGLPLFHRVKQQYFNNFMNNIPTNNKNKYHRLLCGLMSSFTYKQEVGLLL